MSNVLLWNGCFELFRTVPRPGAANIHRALLEGYASAIDKRLKNKKIAQKFLSASLGPA